MLTDYISYGFKHIGKRKMRSWLTMIGIFIGIAAVVSLVSLGQGLKLAIQDQFQTLGADKLIVQSKGVGFGSTGVGTTATPLTKKDTEEISRINGIETVVGMNFRAAIIEFQNKQVVYLVYGMPQGEKERKVLQSLATYAVETGRDLKKGEKGKAVVGYRYNHDKVFDRNLKLGDKIIIKGETFEIVGFMKKIGSEYDDTVVYIDQDQMKQLFETDDVYEMVFVQSRTGVDPQNVVAPIEKALRKTHDVKEGQEDFEVQTFQDYLNSYLVILDIVSAVIYGIAAISLLVGAIGIANTMYTAVIERTKEIGVMKAIGAKNSDILTIFIIESGMLGMAGGIIGVGLGFGIGKTVEFIGTKVLGSNLLKAYFPAWLIIGALVFAMIIGIASGIFPAKQASSLQPVEALRYE